MRQIHFQIQRRQYTWAMNYRQPKFSHRRSNCLSTLFPFRSDGPRPRAKEGRVCNVTRKMGQTSTLARKKWTQFNHGNLCLPHHDRMHHHVRPCQCQVSRIDRRVDRSLQSPFEDDQPSANNVIPPKNPMPADAKALTSVWH